MLIISTSLLLLSAIATKQLQSPRKGITYKKVEIQKIDPNKVDQPDPKPRPTRPISFEEQLLEYHNEVRLHPYRLRMDERLNMEAQWWAEQMASLGYLRHSDLPYGENIAKGQLKEKEVFDDWMNSTEGHKENIKNKEFKYVGFGCAKDKNGVLWWCALYKKRDSACDPIN